MTAPLIMIREIAEALGIGVRAVQLRAATGAWAATRLPGSAHAFGYSEAALPQDVRTALALKRATPPELLAPATDRTRNDDRGQHLWSLFARKPEKQQARAKRRLDLVIKAHALIDRGENIGRAIDLVAEIHSVPAGNLRRWCGAVRGLNRSDWLPALAPRWAGRTATVACSVPAWDFFKADYLRHEAPRAEAVYRRLQRAAVEHGWTIPSCRTLQRRIEREISPMGIVFARKGTDAAKRMYPAQQRDRSCFKALEAVNADGHKLDVFARFDDGRIGRPIASVWQDVYSGKILSWRIGEVESAETIRLSFADLVERYSIPDRAVLDNGRGFASKWMTGGAPTRFRFKVRAEEPEGVLTALGVEVHWAQPYSGQSKPIERAFRDLAESVSRHPALAGAYTGNSPEAKPENYGSRAAPIAEVRRIFAEEAAAHNARTGRRSATCAGRSFDETFAESYATALIRKATVEQRRLLLLAAEGVAANREDGSIRLMGNRYWTDATELMRLAGRKVVVRFDPQNLALPVHVYRLDGGFVATAELVERAGFLDAEAGKAHARDRNRLLGAQRAQLQIERRMSARQAAAMLPAPPAAATPAEPKVVRPLFRQPHSAAATGSAATRTAIDEAFSEGVQQLRRERGLPEAG